MRLHSIAALALVAALTFAVAACGGDDNKDSSGGVTIGGEATQPPTGTTPPAAAGNKKKKKQSSSKSDSSKKKSSSGSGSNGNSGSSGDSRANNQQGGSNKQPTRKSKELANALEEANSPDSQDKISYAAAKGVCAERPISEIKKLYKPKGTSDEDIAKAVSSFYNPKHRREAAYDGCIAGLKSR